MLPLASRMSGINLSTSENLSVWQSLRNSITAWNGLQINLLANGTTLLFASFGIILSNAEKLGNILTFLISLGLFLGTIGINLTIWNLDHSTDVAIESAKALENELFGEGKNPRKITTNLSNQPIWGLKLSRHYLFWSTGLMVASGLLTLWGLVRAII